MEIGSRISVVIPFLNEEVNLPDLVAELRRMQSENEHLQLEYVFVDDGSTDDSIALLNEHLDPTMKRKIIKLSRNYGSYNALRVGVAYASYDIVSFLYADLQDPVDLIPELYNKLQEGNDIVVAERKTTQYAFTDRIFSELNARLIRKYITPAFPEKGFDVVMFRGNVKSKLNENIEADSNIFLQILRSGFKQAFIKYDKIDRTKGESKWSFSAKVKAFLDIFIGFSFFPVRVIMITGVVMFLLSFVWLAIYLFLMLDGSDPGLFQAAVIFLLLFCFGFTNISLGLLGEYLWRILNAARKRPAFTVDQVIES